MEGEEGAGEGEEEETWLNEPEKKIKNGGTEGKKKATVTVQYQQLFLTVPVPLFVRSCSPAHYVRIPAPAGPTLQEEERKNTNKIKK